jgi:hypothetical protein
MAQREDVRSEHQMQKILWDYPLRYFSRGVLVLNLEECWDVSSRESVDILLGESFHVDAQSVDIVFRECVGVVAVPRKDFCVVPG